MDAIGAAGAVVTGTLHQRSSVTLYLFIYTSANLKGGQLISIDSVTEVNDDVDWLLTSGQ